MSAPSPGLAAALVGWMADNRALLDARMSEEASYAIHEEFMLAEGGTLPDRATRIERARQASARAWMRHLGAAIEAEWTGAEPGLAESMRQWAAAHRERREALTLEALAVSERRGASGDPEADRRDADLAAHCRFLAETLASVAPAAAGDEGPPEFSRRVAAWCAAHDAWRREVETEARRAWGAAPPPGAEHALTAAPARDADETRVAEAAAVWSHVRVLAEALGEALEAPPGTPA